MDKQKTNIMRAFLESKEREVLQEYLQEEIDVLEGLLLDGVVDGNNERFNTYDLFRNQREVYQKLKDHPLSVLRRSTAVEVTTEYTE